MEQITFTCELITPLFMSGADGVNPELRAPSVKGALRFWWRAMNGHLLSKKEDDSWDYALLRKKEIAVFGGIEGNNSVRSPVNTIVEILSNEVPIKGSELPNRDGVKYLLYTLSAQNKDREGYKEGLKFNISLSSSDRNALQQASAALWILAHLGGLGTRSRRGCGNFMVTKVEDKNDVLQIDAQEYLSFDLKNADAVEDYLSSNFMTCNIVFGRNENANIEENRPSNLSYTTVRHDCVRVHTESDFENYIKALDDAGQQFKQFRSGIKGHSDILYKSALGLPLASRYSRPPTEIQAVNHKEFERRASPIIVRLLKKDNKEFYWLFTSLLGEFLSPNEEVRIMKVTKDDNNRRKLVPLDGYTPQLITTDVVDDFWNFIKEQTVEI